MPSGSSGKSKDPTVIPESSADMSLRYATRCNRADLSSTSIETSAADDRILETTRFALAILCHHRHAPISHVLCKPFTRPLLTSKSKIPVFQWNSLTMFVISLPTPIT